MPKLELLNSGVIFRNPNPGYRYIFAVFSHPLQLSSQEFICAYNRGQAIYATDLTFWLARSTDGGTTWNEHSVIYDPTRDAIPYSYHSPFLSRMQDGELVIAAFRVDRSDPDRPLFSEETGGLVAVEVILLRSQDNGRTWTEPEVIDVPRDGVLTPSTGIVELANGAWFLPFDRWHSFDDPGPYRPRTVGLFSTDRGRTWGEPVTFADGEAAGKGFWHGRIVRLHDDRLFTLFWSADRASGATLPLHSCFGSVDGRAWSDPDPTNLLGQTNQVADLGGGRMVVIYTQRDVDRPGFRVALSEDWGKTWDLDNQILIWDATGRDRLGVDAPETYPRSHDTIAFGAPTATTLQDGTILTSFWCTEMSITHIRYARLRVVG